MNARVQIDTVKPVRNNKVSVLKQSLKRWWQNYRSRRQLEMLSHYELKDIGVSRAEALEEAKKPFWRR
ncbi:DUF1127 domain-containing protein [Pontibacterium sp.]|uniref:DUF1127 domain-containing protein n=1 Tax=Pontibacterium sp. TaxID=2036026 RepID=UPI00351890AB